MRAQHDRGADERAGLQDVHVLELGECESLAHRVQVDGLPARHAARAARGGEELDHLQLRVGPLREAVVGEELEGEALQRVARKQCRGLVEFHVAGGLAAPQHVVVHARKVVVDERVGVDHLDRGRGDLEALGIGLAHLSRGVDQHRPHALSAPQRRVAHRVVQARGRDARDGKQVRKGRLHAARHIARPGLEVGVAHFSGVKSRSASPSRIAMRAWACESFDSHSLMSSAPRW